MNTYTDVCIKICPKCQGQLFDEYTGGKYPDKYCIQCGNRLYPEHKPLPPIEMDDTPLPPCRRLKHTNPDKARRNAEMCRMKSAGCSLMEIANATGVSESTVERYTSHIKTCKNEIRDQKIIRRFTSGETGTKLAREYNISVSRLFQILKRAE